MVGLIKPSSRWSIPFSVDIFGGFPKSFSFLYSTTKLVMGQPPSNHAAKSRTMELELTLISSTLVTGATGADPIVWADTVSVRSPTPKSFTAYIKTELQYNTRLIKWVSSSYVYRFFILCNQYFLRIWQEYVFADLFLANIFEVWLLIANCESRKEEEEENVQNVLECRTGS